MPAAIGDTAGMGAARPTVFVCYSWDDRFICEHVRARLAPLADERLIDVWRDSEDIRSGDRLHETIAAAIDRSAIAVLLVSDSFMHPDGYAWKHEVPRIRERAEAGGLIVLALYVARSTLALPDWNPSAPVNQRDRPLAAQNADEAARVLDKLVADIRDRVQRLDAARPPEDWVAAITRGVAGATAERVRSFIHEYISTPKHVVAFGGRHDTLAALGAWVDDDAAPQHCFLVAPTGLGKSAVVCHFVQALAARGDVAVAFLPVSLRFGTSHAGALREALVDRLLRLHNDRPLGQAGLDATLAALSEKLRRPLPDGRRLVVVIDGLDEAADWEFGAGQLRELADRTKVLISTRGAPDVADRTLRDRLALSVGAVRVGTLAPLDSAEIHEALYRAGWADLASNPTHLSRIVELSEGDPLVLHLLLDELSERGEDEFFASGPDLRPGLQNLWERQLTRADREAFGERGATTALFAILACALGPVGGADLMALAPDDLPGGGVLVPVLRRWHRFVLRTEAGFSFFYPRLQQFYAEEMMSPSDRARWQSILLRHGRAAIERLAADPRERPSAFVLQFHGAHLDRYGGDLDDYAMLVTPTWRNAWAQHPGRDAGFIRDVDRAWSAAIAADVAEPTGLPVAVRCALTRATLRSENQNLRPEVIAAAVRHGAWTPSRALAELDNVATLATDPHDEQVVGMFTRLRPFLTTPGLLRSAIDVAVRLANSHDAPQPFLSLVAPLAEPATDELVRAARRLHHDRHRCLALMAIAHALPAAQDAQRRALRREAVEVLRSIVRPRGFLAALSGVAAHVIALEAADRLALLDLAKARAGELENGRERATWLKGIAAQLHGEERTSVARVAFEAACTPGPPDAQVVVDLIPLLDHGTARVAAARLVSSALDGVVELLLRDRGEAWALLDAHLDGVHRASLATAWSTACIERPWSLRMAADAGRVELALAAARGAPAERRDDALVEVAHLLEPDEQLALLSRLAASPETPDWHLAPLVDALAATHPGEVVAALLRGGQPRLVAKGAIILARRPDDDGSQASVEQARAAARRIPGGLERLELLAEALSLSPTPEAIREVVDGLSVLPFQATRAIRMRLTPLLPALPSARAAELSRFLSPHPPDAIDPLAPDADARLLTAGRAGIAQVPHGWQRVQAALHLASLLDGSEAQAAVQDALTAARAIGDLPSACLAIARLAPRQEVQRRALAAACSATSDDARFSALAILGATDGVFGDEGRAAVADAAAACLDDLTTQVRWDHLRHVAPERRSDIVTRRFARVCASLRAGIAPTTDALALHTREELAALAAFLTPEQAAEALALIPRGHTALAVTLLGVIAKGDAAMHARCDSAVAEVIAAARRKTGVDRPLALAVAIRLVPEAGRDAFIEEILSGVLVDSGNDARSGMLHRLAPYLREPHLADITALALDAWESWRGAGAFVTLLTVPLEQRDRFAADLYAGAVARGDRPMVVADLLPLLPDGALGDVVDALTSVTNLAAWAVLVDQAGRFAVTQLDRLFASSHAHSRRGRARPHDTNIDVLGAVGAELLRRVPRRRGQMRDLVVELVEARATDRVELLNAIAGLAPLLRELVGPAGIDAIAGEILDVTEWWP